MSDLIPPDLKQCQVEKPNGHTFMTLGGRPGGTVRCTNKPTVILKEKRPAVDGKCGSMSSCPDCLTQFLKQYGPDFATVTYIKQPAPKKMSAKQQAQFLKETSEAIQGTKLRD